MTGPAPATGPAAAQDAPAAGSSVVAEGLRIARRDRRPVFGSAFLVSAAALIVGGGIVAAAFAASWGLLLEAGRSAQSSIDYEESYVAYVGQWDRLVMVAFVVYPLLFLVGTVLLAWLLTAQAVTVAHGHAAPGPESGALTARALWRRTRPHLGAAFRIQMMKLLLALVPALAGLLLLVAVLSEMIPGIVWPTYHEPATPQFLLVGRVLPVVIWGLGLVLLSRFSLATAVRVADNCSGVAAMHRSWKLTRTARLRTAGICLLGTAVAAAAFALLKWFGAYVAHWAGLLMLATTDDNVWITGVLVIIVPVAVALVLLPPFLAPTGVVLACLRERLDGRTGEPRAPSGATTG